MRINKYVRAKPARNFKTYRTSLLFSLFSLLQGYYAKIMTMYISKNIRTRGTWIKEKVAEVEMRSVNLSHAALFLRQCGVHMSLSGVYLKVFRILYSNIRFFLQIFRFVFSFSFFSLPPGGPSIIGGWPSEST